MTALSDTERRLLKTAYTAIYTKPHLYAQRASRHQWRPYKFLTFIGKIIAQAVQQQDARIIINLPPRHGKSELISFWTPLWFLDRDPTKRIILASHGAELATDFGRRVRNELATNDWCCTSLREDSKAAGRSPWWYVVADSTARAGIS